MLENTPIWTLGEMHLWVNNKPAKVYVPRSNPEEAYQILQSRLSKEGNIPIGIDHLPDNIIEANPILAKLDLLNVGEITEIQYTDDAIKIVEAELTNPLIKQLYEFEMNVLHRNIQNIGLFNLLQYLCAHFSYIVYLLIFLISKSSESTLT